MKFFIVANWKMNPQTLAQAKELFSLVKRGIKNVRKTEAIICPPCIYISNLKAGISNLKLGAQNVFWEEKGAFTGEISPLMLKNLGADYVIIGHSERRRYFKETDEIINKKIKAAIGAGITPILCVGETQKQKDKGETGKVLKKQIETDLKGISKFKIQNSKFSVAYEPIWAIGTGNACGIEDAQKTFFLVRKILAEIYGLTLSKKISLLYGGSVKAENAEGYLKKAGFNGLLVGGASLKSVEFLKIVKIAEMLNVKC